MNTDKQKSLLNRRVIIKNDPMKPLIKCQGLRGRVLQVIGNRYKIHFAKAERYTEDRDSNDLWFNREDFVPA